MHRALWPLLVAGCAQPAALARAPAPAEVRAPVESVAEPEWGARVLAVDLVGLVRVPRALVAGAIHTQVGDPLDEAEIAADVRRLYELESFDEVEARTEHAADGVRLTFVVRERALVGRVEYRGPRPLGRHVPLASGELHDPARLWRAARGLEDHLRESGHLDARVWTRERKRGRQVDVVFFVTPGPRYLLSELVFVGNAGVPSRELLALVDDHDGRANRAGTPFRPDLLARDRLRIQALYYDRGYLDAKLGEPRGVRDARARSFSVEWPVDEGGVYRLEKIVFTGQLRAPERRYRELLGLAPEQVFSRARVAEGLARIRAHHQRLGRDAEVTPETELDARAHRVSLRVRIEEAPR